MRTAAMILVLVYGCGGGAPAPQAADGGMHSSGAAGGGDADGASAGASDGGTVDGGASGGATGTPLCSPAGTVKCSGDGDGDGKGDGDSYQCDPSYGWSLKQRCRWSCQDGACSVCALENQPCSHSSDCQQYGYGLVTCIEVGGSKPCGSSNVTDCVCIYNGYALGCVESMECAPGDYCASDGICRAGCYPTNEPCLSDDQCCSGKCQMHAGQCSGDCE